MPNVLVRGIPDEILEALKRRASEHRRSLQQELLGIIEEAAKSIDRRSAASAAQAIRQRLEATDRDFGDSTVDIREDRLR